MHVHQELRRVRDVEQRIAGGRHLAEPRADHDQQVRILDGGGKLGIGADAGAADVAAMPVVEVVLVAEGRRDGQIEALGEGLDGLLDGGAPAGPADDHQRALRLGELRPAAAASRRRRAGLGDAGRLGVGASHSAASMSSGRPSTTGPGRPERAAWKAWLTYSGMRSVWRITAAHFTNEENSCLISISWNASRSSWLERRHADERTMGVESCCATCSPLMALAAPGRA